MCDVIATARLILLTLLFLSLTLSPPTSSLRSSQHLSLFLTLLPLYPHIFSLLPPPPTHTHTHPRTYTEKSTYHTLNLFKNDVAGNLLRGRGWVLSRSIVEVRQLFIYFLPYLSLSLCLPLSLSVCIPLSLYVSPSLSLTHFLLPLCSHHQIHYSFPSSYSPSFLFFIFLSHYV
jgi:hypothetical protein